MPLRIRLWPVLVLVAVSSPLAVAGPARADRTMAGSISTPTVTPIGADRTVTVTAQLSLSATCAESEFCGFYPVVTTVPGGQPCVREITGSSWIGENVYAPAGTFAVPPTTFTATWQEWPSLYSGPKTACVYVSRPDQLVAQVNYSVPPLPATPAVPTPAPTATPPVEPTPQGKPAVQFTLAYFMRARKRETRFSKLSLNGVPSGATIKVTCRGGCPRRSLTLRNRSGTVPLKAFRNRAIRAGAKLTVTVTKPGASAMVKVVTIRSNKAPTIVTSTAP